MLALSHHAPLLVEKSGEKEGSRKRERERSRNYVNDRIAAANESKTERETKWVSEGEKERRRQLLHVFI